MEKIHENISEGTLKTKNDYRNRIELLRGRINLLTGKDRLLMTMYIENGNSFRQMALLAGVTETRIARRIHKITKRLTDGKYIICLKNRNKFTKAEMDIARQYYMTGLSIKKIAAKPPYSYYGVRKTLKRIQHLVTIIEAAAHSHSNN